MSEVRITDWVAGDRGEQPGSDSLRPEKSGFPARLRRRLNDHFAVVAARAALAARQRPAAFPARQHGGVNAAAGARRCARSRRRRATSRFRSSRCAIIEQVGRRHDG